MKEKYQVDDGQNKKWILESIGKKWKDNRVKLFAEFYDPSLSREANIELHPEGIPIDQWATFLDYRLSEDTKVINHTFKMSKISLYHLLILILLSVIQEICVKNTDNRKKQTIPHTLGSKTLARKKRELV